MKLLACIPACFPWRLVNVVIIQHIIIGYYYRINLTWVKHSLPYSHNIQINKMLTRNPLPYSFVHLPLLHNNDCFHSVHNYTAFYTWHYLNMWPIFKIIHIFWTEYGLQYCIYTDQYYENNCYHETTASEGKDLMISFWLCYYYHTARKCDSMVVYLYLALSKHVAYL